ncbi:MAG: glutamate-5-semialdehyde dehydrogenase [Saprospiraceae bacterium]|jgi:glutamate-5-semialdehyde dehydrogenase
MLQQNTQLADLQKYFQGVASRARDASLTLNNSSTQSKNHALELIAEQLLSNQEKLITENTKDLEAGAAKGLSSALLDRLELNKQGVQAMATGLQQIASLADPVGQISDMTYRPSGIQVGKMRVPLGVIGIIYESRPNVTADAAALCLKSGNATVLRGGSEAIHSNLAIADCIAFGLDKAGLSRDCVQVLEKTDRSLVDSMITADRYIDVIIPRGGKALIERISHNATVPVIKHLDGICHVYIDDEADVDKAVRVAYNAKARRYGICGAMETLLVNASIAENVLPNLEKLYTDKGIELRGCSQTQSILTQVKPATEEDWQTEYLDAILSIKIVNDIDEAMAHIAQYGSGHTDSIITENITKANRFLREVDSSSVMVNASTQFADGFEYGLGAEIGISTNKLHVRGPVGLDGLTCQKYIVIGEGHARA